MTATKRPRRHSAAVYRRRRLVLLLAILVIAGGIAWLLIAQPWRSVAAEQAASGPASPSATSSTTPTPSGTPDANPTPEATATPEAAATTKVAATPKATPAATGTAKPCVARDILVEPLTDADTYSAGQNPQLSIRLTNDGELDCTLNVGTTTQSYVVTSGNDVWWRSTDCQTEPSDMIVTLAAGQTVTSATPLVWDRTRSSVSTCDDADRQVAPGGGASYHVGVEIGGVASVGEKLILLY